MERITITVDNAILQAFDAYMKQHGYDNRSEAFRDLLREKLTGESMSTGATESVVACLSYVYDHGSRDLANRMVAAQHAHHDLTMATLHVHLDHENCLETAILRGPFENVRAFAQGVLASTGVRHGNLHLIPVLMDDTRHRHHGAESRWVAAHGHSHPKA